MIRNGQTLTKTQWQRLQDLRLRYIGQGSLAEDYWQDDELLQLYDLTLGARIRWKWDAVLQDLRGRGWGAFTGVAGILDWGCGTGGASRSLFSQISAAGTIPLHLWDRSKAAGAFARSEVLKSFPNSICDFSFPEEGKLAESIVLISHVLTELNATDLQKLVDLLRRARGFIWVEPGTPLSSQHLIKIRNQCLDVFGILGPCLHAGSCGMLAPERVKDWCHFFASPPQEVFHEKFWSDFESELKIDRKSLPVSYLAMERADSIDLESVHAEDRKRRVIARLRHNKAGARGLICDSSGVREEIIPRKESACLRKLKDEFCVLV